MYCCANGLKSFCLLCHLNFYVRIFYVSFVVQINDMTNYMEMFSNNGSSSILNPSEGSNDLLITRFNSVLTGGCSRAARDFYLLLIVYVNCFCIPVLSFVLKGLFGFGKSAQCKFSERARFVYSAITFFVENRKCISMLAFSRKGQIEYIFLSGDTYRKTVLL